MTDTRKLTFEECLKLLRLSRRQKVILWIREHILHNVKDIFREEI
jgi:hypothetical protein